LNDISFAIKPGQVVGFVGASGSGKSTIAKLVQRLYLPISGQILIDNNDLAHVNPSWVRKNIGVVLQENLLFNNTIHENIALANPLLNRQQVIKLAMLSGAHEFIVKMPRGYDTIVEERGVNLSGGQRQRIAIARAMSTNPPIIIFDEATSALDYESERIIQDNMSSIVKGRTVIIIAHRLAAVRNCDLIFGVSDGNIVEVGTHDTLLSRNEGIYKNLWNLQNFRNS
jgi:subfamily B ATP-binding cassette protein HlyB/CyaB